MAKAKTSMDMLKHVASKATKATPKKEGDDRWTLNLADDPGLEQDVYDYVRVKTVANELDPLVKQRKAEVELELFSLWADKFWQDKKVPSNPRVLIKKRDEKGQPTQMDDASMILQVQFKKGEISKVVPSTDNLSPDQTIQDVLKEMLMSEAVGLDEKKADEFLHPETGEIIVEDEVYFVDSLNSMLTHKSEVVRSAAEKLLAYVSAEGKNVRNEPLTDAEKAEIFKTRQIVSMREGFYERAFTYCKTRDQLYNLILFTKPGFVLSSVQFAISDKRPERVDRLAQTVSEFLGNGE